MAVGGIALRKAAGRSRLAWLVLLTAVLWSVLAGRAMAAEGPYEPNDAMPSAAGPLLGTGTTLFAALDSVSDRDFYFFYVTSAIASRTELTVQNLGGGDKSSNVDVTIFDTSTTAVGAQNFIRDGETRVVSVELQPQKYFVEVSASEGFGDSYSLTTGGEKGAFGPYEQIGERCAKAMAAVKAGQRRLSRAESKLQRATARVRRSRYSPPAARKKARVARRKAKRGVVTSRRALLEARSSRQPWCSIAP